MSPLAAARLQQLHGWAAHHLVVDDGGVAAFLLAFREGSTYDSPNYRWFAARYPAFLYIDRVAVAAPQRGRGFGSRLYEETFALARSAGVPVTCEFDLEPPNPVSGRFHLRFGFTEVGRQRYGAAGKLVSLQHAAPGAT
ncbi:MAG: GNAT family N-acetyltransferase [Burkholderiales bacterium]|nr:GNAT family N-acetyltransferase [Burkholderiales bacterium]